MSKDKKVEAGSEGNGKASDFFDFSENRVPPSESYLERVLPAGVLARLREKMPKAAE